MVDRPRCLKDVLLVTGNGYCIWEFVVVVVLFLSFLFFNFFLDCNITRKCQGRLFCIQVRTVVVTQPSPLPILKMSISKIY